MNSNSTCALHLKPEELASEQLCLTNKDVDKIESATNKSIDDLEKIYKDPFTLLKDINDSTLKNSIKFQNLKPLAKVDKYSWLNNLQVDQIQDQFSKMFPGYHYSYIHMADLIMFSHDLSKFVKKDIKPITEIDFGHEINTNPNFKTYGVIFNTDPSTKSGQHWYCIFCDFRTKPYTIEYFNSAGSKPQKHIFRFFTKLAIDIKRKTGVQCDFIQVTNIQHQGLDSGLCGCFATFYIYSRLNGVDYSEFNNKKFIVNDNIILQIRKLMFNDSSKFLL